MKKLLFVDDEPRVLQGLQRQLRGMRHEWEMRFVESGAQALELMAAEPVEVIVSDMVMPGMDGAQLLTEVMRSHPATIRLVLSGHSEREAVLRLVGPAHQYLSKPCNAEELRCAIARALALRDLLSSQELKHLASRIRCLPSLPSLYMQLNEELRSDEPSMERVAQIVSRDMGMTTKILQLVNSAFFGLPQPAGDVMEAAIYLGLSTLRALVLSLEVFSQFDARTIRDFSLDTLAEHCWLTGVLARRIAAIEGCDLRMADQCFLAGLLHDVGYLVLAAGVPEHYSRVFKAAQELKRPVYETETSQLGASHAEVGAYLLGLWGLPNPVIEAVALHHRPAAHLQPGFSTVIAVHVADALAHEQKNRIAIEGELDLPHLKKLGLENRLEIWRQTAAGQ